MIDFGNCTELANGVENRLHDRIEALSTFSACDCALVRALAPG